MQSEESHLPLRVRFSRLLIDAENIDVILIGEAHNDNAARSLLIENIDLIEAINQRRPVVVLMEHLPYQEGKLYGSSSDKDSGIEYINVFQQALTDRKNESISPALAELILQKTAIYSAASPQYLKLAKACLSKGIYFGGLENEMTRNSSAIGSGGEVARIEKGDQAFTLSITQWLEYLDKIPFYSNKPLVIALSGTAHLFGVKDFLTRKNCSAYAWEILQTQAGKTPSHKSHINIKDYDLHHVGLKAYLEEKHGKVTIDVISKVNLPQELEYSRTSAEKHEQEKKQIFDKNFEFFNALKRFR